MHDQGYSTYQLRVRAVEAVLRGRSIADVADAYGTDRSTVFRWVQRYELDGEPGLHRRGGHETHVSLTAFLGKTWSPRGKTPKATVTGKRGGVAAMSAITRRGQLLFRLHQKRIASPEVIDFLSQLLKHHPRRHRVVVIDQAPPHTSKKTRAYIDSQPRLHVFHLPKYSPDWNPDEKVWNHLKHQELTQHRAKTKEELTALTRRKLQSMAKKPQLIRGLFFRCCVADLFG